MKKRLTCVKLATSIFCIGLGVFFFATFLFRNSPALAEVVADIQSALAQDASIPRITSANDANGNAINDTDDIIAYLGKNPLVRGVTLSGGEPMMQPEPLYLIAKAAKEKGMNVWCYTGFTLENLLKENRADRMKLLSVLDVLVDGPFLSHERSLDLLYCGSKNQRLIDVPATLAAGEIRLYVPPEW